jgi:uncharacterized protein YdeI (YjbR/CyaY-like superfamily)
MTKQETNPDVEFYFENDGRWKDHINHLRSILLDCGLIEQLKWGCPCYVFNNSNVVLIHVFKEYCALLFFKGALLKDPDGLLVQQTKNVQAARQLRFTDTRQIKRIAPVIKSYIYEAIEVEKAGLKVKLKKTSEYSVPPEFESALQKRPALKKAFASLTPGRQRAYLHFFSSAKQTTTRKQRVEKYIPKIMGGKGLDD